MKQARFDVASAEIRAYKHPWLEVNGQCLGGIRLLPTDSSAVENAPEVAVDIVFGFNAVVNHNWVMDRAKQWVLPV
jgi:hypothetical protein